MSVDQLPTRQPPRRSDDAKLVRCEDYIESKIQSTRRTVKAVDLSTAIVTLVASVLAYLLIVAVVEHWVMPGGFNIAERLVLFAILVVGTGYFIYKRLWPLLVNTINPVYAARAIEEHSPSLKNSLINLLFFRERRAGISEAVYRTLEEQAAQRLTHVPLETSVDRSLLIRLGYVLLGVVAIAGLYKVFSPKDPLVSAERILLPWADIVPASRVTIAAVTPGSATVSRGEFVDVSAEVHGLGDDDAMVLRYTTADGQVVGRAIPMKPAGDGLRYACRVSDEADGSEPVGLTRSLTYRLEAGDARSLDYSIKVISAPSILVEHVDYHYPPYTGYIDRTVDGLGDIRAIEGTRMTIHARANGEIRAADVDFDADGRPDLRMTTKETGANVSFELSLREDRQTPRHASYVLRFTNDEGRANRDPVKHSIAVDRDQDPVAAVLSPKEKAIDARLDETVFIEVEASDPDFKLSAVRLHGEANGQSALDESLLKGEHKGRFTTRYSFVPNAHGLKSGDVVQYWVEAGDNRTPKPNMVATEKRTIRIVSPNPGQQPPPDRVARNDRQQPKPGGEQQGGQQEQGGQQHGKNQGEKNQGGAADQKNNADQQQGGESSGQQRSGEKQGQEKGEKQQGGEGNKSGQQNADNQQQSKGDSKSGGEGQGENAQGGEQKGNEQKPGENAKGGSQSKSGDGSNDQQQNKGEQTGAGASGGQQSKDAARSDGARPDQGDKSQQPNDGKQQGNQKSDGQQQGEKQSKPGEQQPAVSSEGDNDGEAFERIQKRMEQSGELKKDEKSGGDAGQKQEGAKQDGKQDKGENGQKAQQDPGKEQREGENKSGESKSQDGKSASADGKSGEKPGDMSQQQQKGEPGKDQNQSAGAKPNGDDSSQKKDQQSEGGSEQKKSPEGQETGSKGPAGAGEEKQNQSAPNGQQGKKPTEKHRQQGSKESTDKQEPPAGAGGKKESDSAGDQGGDKSGGGEEGAGQKSPREGTGSAGDHQSADNGTGESAEKGKGDKSSSGGKDAKSDHKTGSSDGKTPGEGGQQKDGSGNKQGGSAGSKNAESRDGENAAGEKGDKAGSKEGEGKGTDSKADQEGKQADKQQQKDGKEVGKQGDQKGGETGKKSDGAEQGKSGGQTEGGGVPGSGNSGPTSTGSAPEGDAANLEYARKRTDLVLDKLSDQLSKNKVDDRMLKELGWTRDDLRRFVERWQQRKDAAQRDDPKGEAAKRELDDALRSLGLQREKLQQNAVQKDSMRDLKQGYRGAVPLEYQERLRAYNQGVSRAARDGE